MTQKIPTVNVIESISLDEISSIRSYPDNKKGNKAAEKIFRKIALENGALKVNLQSHIEDGYFQEDSYKVYLIHSL